MSLDELYGAFDWKSPNYNHIFLRRTAFVEKIRKQPELILGLKAKFKDDPVAFVQVFGCTVDPRLAEIGLPTTIPFILFPKQEECVRWLVERWKARESGVVEKSRDMGASWLCVAVAVWMWLYYPGTVIGFGSRKEEYVDKIGDPKTLFWKIRQFIRFLPKEFRPKGYDETKHAPHMRVLNPENGAAIVGEAGDNIGRGNRTSWYCVDEAAFLEHPEAVDAALSQTTNCRIDVSTPNGNGNPFYRKRHGGRIPVFSIHWTDDPRKDEKWYRKQCETLDPVIVAQEIDIDYNSSVADAWIDGALMEQAQKNGPAEVQAIGQWIVGVDAAHFGDDESIIHKRKGRLNLPQVTRKGVDGVQLAGAVEEECRELEMSGDKVFAIVVELDGPGVSCYDQLKKGPYASRVQGVHTGSRLADNINYNLRAKMWRDARDYLKSPPVSMPRDTEMKSQLCSVRYRYKDGLLIMQDKKEYKKLFGKSPDRADAFVLTFAVSDPPKKKPAVGPLNWQG